MLLVGSSLLHLFVQVTHEQVDHRDHTIATLGLLGVRTEGLGRRGWCGPARLRVRGHLCEDSSNTCSCDATGRRGWDIAAEVL